MWGSTGMDKDQHLSDVNQMGITGNLSMLGLKIMTKCQFLYCFIPPSLSRLAWICLRI